MIKFRYVKFKNLLSFGNMETVINFEEFPTTLVRGRNGSGKSVILDAVCYGLFGKPFRNINRPKLVNTKNSKHLLVELSFTIGKDEYLIIRGMNPKIFEVYKNGNLQHQNSRNLDYQLVLEEDVLKFNYESFTQIVILGKATYTSFMRLKTPQRRQFIEQILGLGVFTEMNTNHKTNVSLNRDNIRETKSKIVVTKEKLSIRRSYIQNIELEITEQSKAARERTNKQISILQKEIEEIDRKLTSAEESLHLVTETDLEAISSKIKEITDLLHKCDYRLKDSNSRLQFFKSNQECPTCGQGIDEELRQDKINRFSNKNKELQFISGDITSKLSALSRQHTEILKKLKENAKTEKTILENQTLRRGKFRAIADLENQDLTPDDQSTRLASELALVKELEKELQHEEDKLEELVQTREEHELVTQMLKDSGIKKMIIQKYTPIINQLINKYLTQLGFSIRFHIDEDFNERIWAHGAHELSYFNFSEGEKLRIDLAVLMTWREIAQLRNNMSTNLLIFDEIFDGSLDEEGSDAFLRLLTNQENLNIIVISHSPDRWAEAFSRSVTFKKIGGYSKIST